MQFHTFSLFLLTVLTLIVTPGPDMLYVAGRSLSEGRNAAILSALGVAIGYAGHTLLVTLGLASVLAASPTVFRAIQMGGAAYLIFLALSLFRSSGASFTAEIPKKSSSGLLIRQGVLTSILNPKGLLFYFALLPQFCTPGTISVATQMLVFGFVTSLLCFTIYCLVGLAVSKAGNAFAKNATLQRFLPKLSGSILLALGIYMLSPLQR